jgi:hypothetical protein
MPIPHRELTEREQELLAQVRDLVHDYYAPGRSELNARLEHGADQGNSQKLQIRLDDMENDENLDTEELAFLTGQRSGFLAGVQFMCKRLQADLATFNDNHIDALIMQALEEKGC